MPLDVLVAIIRIAFVALLYLFLLQIIRVLSRGVVGGEAALTGSAPPVYADGEPHGRLIMTDATRNLAAGYSFPLNAVNQIGRRPENDIIIEDEFVSGEHALLVWRDGNWWLSDVASTNGTFINGEEIQEPTVVRPGDVLGFGRVKSKLT